MVQHPKLASGDSEDLEKIEIAHSTIFLLRHLGPGGRIGNVDNFFDKTDTVDLHVARNRNNNFLNQIDFYENRLKKSKNELEILALLNPLFFFSCE